MGVRRRWKLVRIGEQTAEEAALKLGDSTVTLKSLGRPVEACKAWRAVAVCRGHAQLGDQFGQLYSLSLGLALGIS